MRMLIVTVLLLAGLAAIAAGIAYLAVPAHSLPHFMPGYLAGANGKHSKRGYVGLGVGVVLLIAGIVVGTMGQPHRRGSLR